MKVYVLIEEDIDEDDEEQYIEILNVSFSKETAIKKALNYANDLVNNEDYYINNTNKKHFCNNIDRHLLVYYDDDDEDTYRDLHIEEKDISI